MTSWARRCISGLPRCTESKSSAAELAPVAIELAALPPMPMRMPGPPSWISRLPAGNSILWVSPASMVPDPTGNHDGLVVARAGPCRCRSQRLLVFAKVAQQVGPAEFVVEGGAAQGPSVMICKRAGNVSGLP
jgi:hypothetical protein